MSFLQKIFLLVIIINLTPVFAQKSSLKNIYNTCRLNGEVPKIDGVIDEDAWKHCKADMNFIQSNPVESNPPSERTAFKVLYDESNIYFCVVAFDSDPDEITTLVARRDDIENSDVVFIGFDSYFDRRTAFVFGINAGGVKSDILFAQDGEHQDVSWDPVWDGAASRTSYGWCAEMKIPFSQIRFAEKDEHTWGFQVYRKIHRKHEDIIWQFIPKDAAGMVSHFGLLKGLKGITMPARIELLPYVVSGMEVYQKEEGNPFATGQDFSINGGMDGKIGVTGDLTLDFTINPDFGQVEADPSEVNLSAFETFFEEKRPFFVEGKSIFSFPIAIEGSGSNESIFYSRRIGRSPQYYPDSSDGYPHDFVDKPDQTTILGALKLSGKTKTGWSVGIIDALTNKENAVIDYNGSQDNVSVEPLTNYFISRLQKDFSAGNTSIGGMMTATNRKIDEDLFDFLSKSAYSGGIDFRHQWANKSYFTSLKLIGSHINGDPAAIERLQLSSARYYQRPDADYIQLDTTLTTLSGHGGTFDIGMMGNSRWRWIIGGNWRSPGLELNDLGYQRNADLIRQYAWVSYRILNPVGIFRMVDLDLVGWHGWNFGGDKLFTGGNMGGQIEFLNYWGFSANVNREASGLSQELLRGGPMTRFDGAWNISYSFFSDRGKDWHLRFNGFSHISDDNITRMHDLGFQFYYKINQGLNFSLRTFYNTTKDNLQYINTAETGDGDRYILGLLDHQTVGIVLRFNYSPTPDLSIQYYGQPFISAGTYSQFKNIDNPRGYGADRYHIYSDQEISYDEENQEYNIDENDAGQVTYSFSNSDFNFKQFRSNLIIRWEYLPGSTLFLVWSQQRTREDDYGDFLPRQDFNNLFSTPADNTFLIKLNYWFSM